MSLPPNLLSFRESTESWNLIPNNSSYWRNSTINITSGINEVFVHHRSSAAMLLNRTTRSTLLLPYISDIWPICGFHAEALFRSGWRMTVNPSAWEKKHLSVCGYLLICNCPNNTAHLLCSTPMQYIPATIFNIPKIKRVPKTYIHFQKIKKTCSMLFSALHLGQFPILKNMCHRCHMGMEVFP